MLFKDKTTAVVEAMVAAMVTLVTVPRMVMVAAVVSVVTVLRMVKGAAAATVVNSD